MGEMETTLGQIFDAMAKKDADAVVALMASEAQGVDEIARKWIRGRADMESYIRGVLMQIEGVETKISDANETTAGDIGILTCWIDQEYTLEGTKAQVSAPTTVLFAREGGAWKMSLFHSIPLPEEG